MCINHSIKASGHVFINLTKCLAKTFRFLVASIGAILFECKLQDFLPLGRIIKQLYLLSYYLTDKSQLYFILY